MLLSTFGNFLIKAFLPFIISGCNFHSLPPSLTAPLTLNMDKQHRKKKGKTVNYDSEEVSSIEWECVNMTEQEEDLICRMYKLVGERWGLIAGRIPGRKAEEIERFWIMRQRYRVSEKRKGDDS